MRMSCNGCRVLRKGCNETCTLRPCLQWITNPEAQGNATLFLAKFYGRAGLLNLITAGPQHLRSSIFRSLLYEACGRIINPIYGSVGLQWSNQWELCEAAVNAVLDGYPIMKLPPDVDAPYPIIPLQSCDIRHLSKDPNGNANGKAPVVEPDYEMMIPGYEYGLGSESSSVFFFTQLSGNHQCTDELILNPAPTRDYFCAETVETSLGIGVGSDRGVKSKCSTNATREIGLELTLGWGPDVVRRHLASVEHLPDDDDV